MLSKCQIEEMQKSWFTCLLDCGWGLCNGGLFADSTLVLGKGPEDVGVTHDQVWNSGIHSVIMLQYCEPVLWRQQLRSVNFRHDYRVNSSFHHGTMSKNNAIAMDHVRKLVIVEKACTPVFLSAFWMVYPVIVVFPLSLGSVHSRATLKPQVSTILMLAGGPGNSGEQVDKKIV